MVLAGGDRVPAETARAVAGPGRRDVIVLQGGQVEVILGVGKDARPRDVEARVQRLASTVREAMLDYAPAAPSLVDGLHDAKTGRIDARKVASFLEVPLSSLSRAIGRPYKSVFKNPASSPIQPALASVHRVISSATRLLGSRSRVLTWMNSPNRELEGFSPLHLVLDGRGEVVADLLDATLAGVTT